MSWRNDSSTLRREWVKSSMRCLIREWAGTLAVNWCGAELRQRPIMRKHVQPICLKELRESRCWIRLIIKTEMLKEHQMGELLDECSQPCNIIARSIVTAKQNRKKEMAAVGVASSH